MKLETMEDGMTYADLIDKLITENKELFSENERLKAELEKLKKETAPAATGAIFINEAAQNAQSTLVL